MPEPPETRTCPVCDGSITAGSYCPRCRARAGGQEHSLRNAWILVGGGLFLLVALYLWSERLGVDEQVAKAPYLSEALPSVADGTKVPAPAVAVPFGNETCVPWNVSAALSPPPGESSFLLLTSRMVDPDALVLSGFGSDCGARHRVVVLEDLPPGKLAEELGTYKPQAIITVGISAFMRARKAAPELPVLFAQVFNPVGAGLDHPDTAGVSPWIPAEPMMRHLLSVLPKKASLGIFHADGPTRRVAEQARVAAEARGREAKLHPIRISDLDETLTRAAGESRAWIVIPDRATIDLEVYNRIQVTAEENKIPLGVSDEEYLRRGALVGVGPDTYRIGRQLCRLAGAAIKDQLPKGSHVFCPEYSFAAIHKTVMEKLGYMLSPNDVRQAKLYTWH